MVKVETIGQGGLPSRNRWSENKRQEEKFRAESVIPSAKETINRLLKEPVVLEPEVPENGRNSNRTAVHIVHVQRETMQVQDAIDAKWALQGIVPPSDEQISWANSQSNNGGGRRKKDRFIAPTIASTTVLVTIASCVNIQEPTAIVEPAPTREELPTDVIEIQLPTPIPSEASGQPTPEVIPTPSFTEGLDGLEATGGPYTPEQLSEAQSAFEERYQSALRVRDELIASRAIAGNANLGLNPVLKVDEEGNAVDANWEWRILDGEIEFNGESYEEGTAVIASYVENHEGEPLWLSPDGASDVLVGAEVNRVGIDKNTGLATAWNNSETVGHVDRQTGQWTGVEQLTPEPTEEPTPDLAPETVTEFLHIWIDEEIGYRGREVGFTLGLDNSPVIESLMPYIDCEKGVEFNLENPNARENTYKWLMGGFWHTWNLQNPGQEVDFDTFIDNLEQYPVEIWTRAVNRSGDRVPETINPADIDNFEYVYADGTEGKTYLKPPAWETSSGWQFDVESGTFIFYETPNPAKYWEIEDYENRDYSQPDDLDFVRANKIISLWGAVGLMPVSAFVLEKEKQYPPQRFEQLSESYEAIGYMAGHPDITWRKNVENPAEEYPISYSGYASWLRDRGFFKTK